MWGQQAPAQNYQQSIQQSIPGGFAPGSPSAQSQVSQDWLAKYLGSGNSYANSGGTSGALYPGQQGYKMNNAPMINPHTGQVARRGQNFPNHSQNPFLGGV